MPVAIIAPASVLIKLMWEKERKWVATEIMFNFYEFVSWLSFFFVGK